MKIEKYIKGFFLFLVTLMFSCENIEDTYKEFTGDGKIKYVGKCKSFSVESGWKRFVFRWEKSPDSDIKEIRIDWKSDKGKGSYTIPIDKNVFETEATFEDIPYTFECYAIDDAGRKSIPLIEYGRPFTSTHELVKGFPKMINKYAFINKSLGGSDLILFLDKYKEEIKTISLRYSKDGKEQNMLITQKMFEGKYFILEDVDVNEAVTVNISAEVEGCIDLVVFEPHILDPKLKNFNYDFSQLLMQKYNLNDITPEFVNQLEVLEIDYSLNSLEDVLFFPNLKKLILGGNRFMVKSMTPVPPPNASTAEKNKIQYKVFLNSLQDKESSVFAITKMVERRGIEVVIHNDHFGIQNLLPFAVQKEDPELPQLSYLNTIGWSVKSSSKEGTGDVDPAEPENLLDNNSTTLWHPQTVRDQIRTHKIDIDMQTLQTVSGFKITQAGFNIQVGKEYFSDVIRVMLSNDGILWEEAFYYIQSTIGANFGESVVLRIPEPKIARYIRIIINDEVDTMYSRSNTCLGDFMVF